MRPSSLRPSLLPRRHYAHRHCARRHCARRHCARRHYARRHYARRHCTESSLHRVVTAQSRHCADTPVVTRQKSPSKRTRTKEPEQKNPNKRTRTKEQSARDERSDTQPSLAVKTLRSSASYACECRALANIAKQNCLGGLSELFEHFFRHGAKRLEHTFKLGCDRLEKVHLTLGIENLFDHVDR